MNRINIDLEILRSTKGSGKFTRTSFEIGDRVQITAPGKKYDGAIARILNITSKETTVGLLVDGRSYSLRISPKFLQKTNKLSANESGEISHQIDLDGQLAIFLESDLPEYNEGYSALEELASIQKFKKGDRVLVVSDFSQRILEIDEYPYVSGVDSKPDFNYVAVKHPAGINIPKGMGRELIHIKFLQPIDIQIESNLSRDSKEINFKVGDRIILNSGQWQGAKGVIHHFCDYESIELPEDSASVWVTHNRSQFFYISPLKDLGFLSRPEELNTISQLDLDDSIYSICLERNGVISKIGQTSFFIDWNGDTSKIPYWAKGIFNQKQIKDLKLVKIKEKICNSHQDTFSAELEEIPREQLAPDIAPSGELKAISTPPPSGEIDSPQPPSTNPISETCQIALFNPLEYQKSLSEVVLARISQLQEVEPDLREVAEICFLSTSDSFDSSSLQFLSGKMLMQSFRPKTGKISPKSSRVLQRWGMWGPGKCEMGIGMSPKTENGFSWWVFSGDVRTTQSSPDRKTLAEILGGSPVTELTGDRIHQSFTLRANSYKQGRGNENHPNTFARVVYRARGGDRIYANESPTLTSPSNTNGHQGGTGAFKVRESEGEEYCDRPLLPEEAEQLMGWEVGSTAIGVNGEGEEISISATQRIKVLGNGIIPAEITEILTAIKPFLTQKLESEIPESKRLAYRQLRRKLTHQEAKEIL